MHIYIIYIYIVPDLEIISQSRILPIGRYSPDRISGSWANPIILPIGRNLPIW